MTDDFFLDRPSQAALVELLDQIPGLVEDLAIAITRQDRMASGIKIAKGSDEQPLPFNEDASESARALHDELARWVRLTCEQRRMTYAHTDDTINLARWLQRWIIALAMTEGADQALHDIRYTIRSARASCDRPREKTCERPPDESLDVVGLTKRELREAIYARRKQRVPRQTIDSWIKRKQLTPIEDGYYRLADALQLLDKTA